MATHVSTNSTTNRSASQQETHDHNRKRTSCLQTPGAHGNPTETAQKTETLTVRRSSSLDHLNIWCFELPSGSLCTYYVKMAFRENLGFTTRYSDRDLFRVSRTPGTSQEIPGNEKKKCEHCVDIRYGPWSRWPSPLRSQGSQLNPYYFAIRAMIVSGMCSRWKHKF